jgi:penicillin-binding protein 2
MYDVVNSGIGTARGGRSPVPGVKIAGKTGTAQVRRISAAERRSGVKRNEALPWKQRDHALFVAFAPTDNPRYAVSVIIEHGIAGGRYAAPIARDVLTFLFEPERALKALGPIEAKMRAEREARERLKAAEARAAETVVANEMMPSWLRTDNLILPPTFEIGDPEAPVDPREDN